MASDRWASRTWRPYGKDDAYYAVCNDESFRSARLDDAARSRFFESGADHVGMVLDTIRRHVAPDFAPRRVLDFGSGVGRLLVPLARIAESALGVDVSPEMNAEAARNCAAAGLSNVQFAVSDDTLSQVQGSFDLVHSFIVFQHIPAPRGERIFAELLSRMSPGGVGAIQFTYARAAPSWRKAINRARRSVPLVNALANVVQGRNIREPLIPMYEYDLGRLFQMLRGRGCDEVHAELTDHGGHHGAMLVFRVPG